MTSSGDPLHTNSRVDRGEPARPRGIRSRIAVLGAMNYETLGVARPDRHKRITTGEVRQSWVPCDEGHSGSVERIRDDRSTAQRESDEDDPGRIHAGLAPEPVQCSTNVACRNAVLA